MIRFALVGLANTTLGYAVYAASLAAGWSFVIASALSMLVSIAVGFLAQGRFVFDNSDPRRIWRYLIMWCLLLLLYNVVVFLAKAAGLNEYIGGLIALPFVIAVSFLAQRLFVFRK